MIEVWRQKSVPSHLVELNVEQVGMNVTVKAGAFKISNIEYVLLEDAFYEFQSSPDEEILAYVYVVKNTSTEAIEIAVEFQTKSDPTKFNWEGAPYENIFEIFNMRVPVGVATLDDVPVRVHHLVDASVVENEV